MTRGYVTEDNSQRQLKACEIIRKELAEIFRKGKHFDEYLIDKSLTISKVKLTVDFKQANIYILPFGSYDKEKILESLKFVTPAIRKVLTKKINFKYSPMIKFFIDDSFDYADKIDKLIQSVNNKD